MESHFEILEKLEIFILHPISFQFQNFQAMLTFELILKHIDYKEKEI